MWQRRLVEQADEFIVPSEFARERLRELGAPLRWERVHVLPPPLRALAEPRAQAPPEPPVHAAGELLPPGGYALLASRLSHEKGVDVAIDACRMAGMALVIAGDGPDYEQLRGRVRGAQVTFVGHLAEAELAALRAGAAVALVPSRAAETFGLAAAEAMAAGVPVIASRVGALAELVEADGLVEPDSPRALAAAIARRAGDREAGERGRARVQAICSPAAVAAALERIYSAGPARAAA
jgi:glycosyltransferase involved in cell wall biosynthesis